MDSAKYLKIIDNKYNVIKIIVNNIETHNQKV